MRPPFASVADLASAFADANISLEELVPDENGSLRRLASSSPLPPLRTVADVDDAEVALTAPISQGGMGQIFGAEQRSVGREVAVKVAAKGVFGTLARGELVAEGRVTGQLEHPNIVPIHILGARADGSPLIVMQRVEGESWAALLSRGRALRRDVDILISVCRALEFAHERGVIHRDVKPQNVMLGRFGEVFLLDWGIAVGFGDRAPPELPRAGAVRDVAGTPQYMAPEMVTPPTAVDARTDIYLAGATLYEVVTGAPPHARDNLASSLFAAQSGALPAFPLDAPEELVAVCTRAMARDPAARFANVAELRAALEDFQRHADARDLCSRGESRLRALHATRKPGPNHPAAAAVDDAGAQRTADDAEANADADAHADATVDADERRAVVGQRAFLEARFAFTLALKSWPESARARAGLAATLAAMARQEIGAGRYDAAALVVAELDPREVALHAELERELRVLRERIDAGAESAAALARYAREHDSRAAERERALVLLAASAGFLVTMCACAFLAAHDIYRAGPGSFAVGLALLSASFLVAGAVVPALRATTASRQMFVVMCASEIGLAIGYTAAWRFGLSIATALALVHCCMALFAAAFATRDANMWRGVAGAALIVPALALLPEHAYVVSGVGTLVAVGAGSIHLWLPRAPRAPREAAGAP